jgi:hypothetical protein
MPPHKKMRLPLMGIERSKSSNFQKGTIIGGRSSECGGRRKRGEKGKEVSTERISSLGFRLQEYSPLLGHRFSPSLIDISRGYRAETHQP